MLLKIVSYIFSPVLFIDLTSVITVAFLLSTELLLFIDLYNKYGIENP